MVMHLMWSMCRQFIIKHHTPLKISGAYSTEVEHVILKSGGPLCRRYRTSLMCTKVWSSATVIVRATKQFSEKSENSACWPSPRSERKRNSANQISGGGALHVREDAGWTQRKGGDEEGTTAYPFFEVFTRPVNRESCCKWSHKRLSSRFFRRADAQADHSTTWTEQEQRK